MSARAVKSKLPSPADSVLLQSDFLHAAASGDLENVWQMLHADFTHGVIHQHIKGEALCKAASNNLPLMAALLIVHDAPLNYHDDSTEYTPIDWASWEGHQNMVQLLMEAGAFLDPADHTGYTPRQNAGKRGDLPDRAVSVREILNIPSTCRKLPLPDIVLASPDELFATDDEHERCMLEHPTTWKRMDDVLALLESQGQRIPLARWLEPSSDGRSWLQRAAASFAFKPVFEHLLRHGESIPLAQLVHQDGTATELLICLAEFQQASHLFSDRNMELSSVHDVQRLHRAVPAHLRFQVENYVRLCSVLQQSEVREGVGR